MNESIENQSSIETDGSCEQNDSVSPETGNSERCLASHPPSLIHRMTIPLDTLKRLEEMNSKHALVIYGGRTRFLHQIENPDAHEVPYQFLDAKAFNTLYRTEPDVSLLRLVAVEGEESVTPVRKALTWAWERWPARRTFTRVGFYPANNAPDDAFNLYCGWGVKAGSGSWKKMLRHIYEVICHRDAARFRWLIDWMTHTVQTTGYAYEKSPVSPVVLGTKGSGKSIAFDQFERLFGKHGLTISNTGQLTGRFNKHFMMTTFCVAEEAVYAHDRKGEGPLKDLLTRATLTIEPKGVDAFESPNYCRFAFLSNEELPVPMTGDERRFQPFEVSDHRVGDSEWFNAIIDEMNNGGREAMLHDLLQRPYDAGLIRFPLNDDNHLNRMRARVLKPEQRFVLEWIFNGAIEEQSLFGSDALPNEGKHQPDTTGAITIDSLCETSSGKMILSDDCQNTFASTDVKNAYDQWRRCSLDQYENRNAQRQTPRLIKNIRENFQFIELYKTNKSRGIVLPPLSKCLEHVMAVPVYKEYLEQLGAASE